MRAELADGTVLEFPDGTDPQVVQATVKRYLSQGEQTENNSLGAQAGLALRAAAKGVAGVPQIVTEPLRYVTDKAYEAVTGRKSPSKPLTALADEASDAVGLPTPDTPTQRIVSKAVELGTGAGGMAGAAKKGADLLAKVPAAFSGVPNAGAQFTRGAGQQALTRLASDPAMQVASGAGAGAAGQHAAENGSGAVGQFFSSLAGGLGGAGLVGLSRTAASKAQALIPKQQQLVQQRVDQRINIALTSQGIDPATITPAMRTALREQVGKAMDLGDLDDAAIARLADYSRLGMKPTRARLTLDPYDVTQEANASKLAAATGARDAKLPQIAQENNQRLVGLVDDMGGAKPVDRYGQGSAAMGAVTARDAALKSQEDALYKAAREMAGGDIPLQRAPFMNEIYQRLNERNLIRFVPPEVQSMLDDISSGVVKRGDQVFETPFDVKTIDTLKSLIAAEQRKAQGSAKMALSAIRDVLDGTPLEPVKRDFGGSQVVTSKGAEFLRNADQQPADLKQALDEARRAAFQRRQWQESAAPIERALGGSNADTFIQQNIISRAAGFDDVARTARVINSDPGARESVRTAIVQHLKDAAIGRGGTSQTGNFSGKGMTAALKDIGDRKLGLFFDADEVETLKAMARTGSFEVFQPRGSAVNNSNTGAALASLLQGVSKYVKPVANKIPFGEVAVSQPLDNLTVWSMQKPALNLADALVATRPEQASRIDPLLLPALYGGGSLAAALEQQR